MEDYYFEDEKLDSLILKFHHSRIIYDKISNFSIKITE